MEYRNLGKSDLKISRIGFGGMSLEPDHAAAANILLRALDGGINYFDTADIYQHGLNETMIGKAFLGRRNEVILATKVGNQWKPDGSGLNWVPSKKHILLSADQSLKRLQTDYIDLYQLHGGTIDDPIDEIIEAFEILKSSGRIRYYGISSIRPNVIREYIKRAGIVSVMMQYSLLDRRPEEEMLGLLQANDIGVLARGSIAKGLLVSKPADPYLNYSAGQVEKAKRSVEEISGTGRTAFAIAVGYTLYQPSVTSAVVGIRTEEQLENALNSIGNNELAQNDITRLSASIPSNYYMEHR
jgi:aryl-alcohol dehydrogenase-like predicted oxidoreductase